MPSNRFRHADLSFNTVLIKTALRSTSLYTFNIKPPTQYNLFQKIQTTLCYVPGCTSRFSFESPPISQAEYIQHANTNENRC